MFEKLFLSLHRFRVVTKQTNITKSLRSTSFNPCDVSLPLRGFSFMKPKFAGRNGNETYRTAS